jgi:hypothetical protein
MPLTIHTCTKNAVDDDYLDVSFEVAFSTVPKVSATADTNVNVFVSDLTSSGCRLNFSAKYTGSVYITAMIWSLA